MFNYVFVGLYLIQYVMGQLNMHVQTLEKGFMCSILAYTIYDISYHDNVVGSWELKLFTLVIEPIIESYTETRPP